jgi:hypothetical protein
LIATRYRTAYRGNTDDLLAIVYCDAKQPANGRLMVPMIPLQKCARFSERYGLQ